MNLSGVDLQGSNHSERRCRHGASFLMGTVASLADAAPSTFFFSLYRHLHTGGSDNCSRVSCLVPVRCRRGVPEVQATLTPATSTFFRDVGGSSGKHLRFYVCLLWAGDRVSRPLTLSTV